MSAHSTACGNPNLNKSCENPNCPPFTRHSGVLGLSRFLRSGYDDDLQRNL